MDELNKLEAEVAELRQLLATKERALYSTRKELIQQQQTNIVQQTDNHNVYQQFEVDMNRTQYGDKLPKWAIERYSRQILLSDIGVPGQERLCSAKVLVVGAGGLGCPAALYLAGAGIGEIGIVDYDTVELTNIHRQILHGECDENVSKAESAAQSLRSINSRIVVTPYNVTLSSSNAIGIVSKYDIVLDCTDNVPTRYLLNDACVSTKKPLISGSALKMEGQLTIYGYRAEKNPNEKDQTYIGPCYRCVFPTPPAADTVGSCSSNGVAGPVPGVIGSLQALEAIKYIVGHTHKQLLVERMLLFDGEDTSFGTVRLRPRSAQCAVCSDHPTITELIDYEVFCKAQAKEKPQKVTATAAQRRNSIKNGLPYSPRLAGALASAVILACGASDAAVIESILNWGKDLDLSVLPPNSRVSATELATLLPHSRHLLVDVRNEEEFHMCRIEGAANMPIEKLRDKKFEELLNEIGNYEQVTFVCRRGNDSQLVAKKVLDVLEEKEAGKIKDLKGGLHAWAKDVDRNFPVY